MGHQHGFYLVAESDVGSTNDESPVAVGLVVGIVGGIIGFLVFISIVIVCCWRRHRQDPGRPVSDFKADLTKTVPPSDSYGLDNNGHKGASPPRQDSDDYFNASPRMKKQLLSQHDNRDFSDTESESRDQDIYRKYEQSPTRRPPADMNFENERRYGNDRRFDNDRRYDDHRRDNDRRFDDRRFENKLYDDNRRNDDDRRPDGVQMRNNAPPAPKPPPPIAAPRQNTLPPKSPVLSALHNNPRFRASFHANEEEAEERAKRISGDFGGGGGRDDGNESDASMTMTWNTTFDTNFDDDPRPPAGGYKPPTLPPVPRSPTRPRRNKNTASIRRDPRPSSSSSEIEQIENGEGRVSMNPQGSEPPAPRGEVIPIRVQDPNASPPAKRKTDTQHTLRPDRGTKAKGNKERKKSPDRSSDSPSSERKAPKATKKYDKSKSSAASTASTEPYESGRFRKADTARKSKGKSPRIGRSRSTGNALDDDASSIGRPTTPRGYENYQRVPKVTADDYEDSDVESNLNYNRKYNLFLREEIIGQYG
jgi:hypothetical protein